MDRKLSLISWSLELESLTTFSLGGSYVKLELAIKERWKNVFQNKESKTGLNDFHVLTDMDLTLQVEASGIEISKAPSQLVGLMRQQEM